MSENEKSNTELDLEIESIKAEIHELRNKLDEKAPIGSLLIKIHSDLFKKPECFAVLSDLEIAAIIEGIEIHTRKELVVGKSKARIKKNYSTSDLDLSL